MKTLFQFLLPISAVALLNASCVKGCIDSNALNYDSEATANSGCIYPETFNLTSVGIKSHPSEDTQGNEWDSDGGPDKFVKVYNHESNTLLFTSSVEEFTPVTWTVDPTISVKSENTILRFELYDQDATEDVLMDQAQLILKDLTGTTATTSNDLYPVEGVINGGRGTAFVLTMTWTE